MGAIVRQGLIINPECGEVRCTVEKSWIGNGKLDAIARLSLAVIPKGGMGHGFGEFRKRLEIISIKLYLMFLLFGFGDERHDCF
jgi:hypothetical protein